MTDSIDSTNATNIAPATSPNRRLIDLDDAIAKIRTQIASADLARQRDGKPIDPDWFHRARTALRHLTRERSELVAAQRGRSRRMRIKDAIIAVLRERHDPDSWDAVLAEARARVDGETR